jgi:hypothetical protein
MLVFDLDYGASEQPDLGDAFWLVESTRNRALAKRIWATGATDPNSAVFQAYAETPTDDEVMSRFEDADLHHPAWKEMEFVGVPLTVALKRQFADQDLVARATDAGFRLRR